MNYPDFPHVYSPAQFARVAAAWSAILAVQGVSVSADCGYPNACEISPETLWQLIWSDGAATERVHAHTVHLLSWSDYGGTCADVANARYLDAEGSPFHGWVTLSPQGGHGAESAWVQLGELPGGDLDTGLELVEQLAAVLRASEVDGLLCQETHDAYISELAAAAWGQWLGQDIPRQLAELIDEHQVAIPRVLLDHGYPVEDASDYTRWLWEHGEQRFADAYYAYHCNQWTCEPSSPTSVVNHTHDDAVRHAAHTAFGWPLRPQPHELSAPAVEGSR